MDLPQSQSCMAGWAGPGILAVPLQDGALAAASGNPEGSWDDEK